MIAVTVYPSLIDSCLHCTTLWLETINMYVETWCVEILMNEGQSLFSYLLVVFYCFSFFFPQLCQKGEKNLKQESRAVSKVDNMGVSCSKNRYSLSPLQILGCISNVEMESRSVLHILRNVKLTQLQWCVQLKDLLKTQQKTEHFHRFYLLMIQCVDAK